MRWLGFAIGSVFFYLIYGLFLSQYDLRIIPKELSVDNPSGFYDYKGVTNVHSAQGSTDGDIANIVKQAQNTDLDFLSFADLNTFDKPKQFEGRHGNLLVFIDGQYSYLNSRLLNYFAHTNRHLQGVGQSQVLFADLLSQANHAEDIGLFVLAHPLRPRFQWTGEFPPGLDGIEIINLKSMWEQAWQNFKVSFLWSLLFYPFNDRLALLRLMESPEEELRLWDTLTQKRRTIGIAGTDAEARIVIGNWNFVFPSYETIFSLVRNHVLLKSELTGDSTSDAKSISNAISQGQFYMSFDIFANPKGFNTYIEADGAIFPIGSEVSLKKDMKLVVHLPHKPDAPFDTLIFRNGDQLMTSNSQETDFFIHEPGVYRVVVKVIPTFPLPDGKKWVPWIFTNPFYVR